MRGTRLLALGSAGVIAASLGGDSVGAGRTTVPEAQIAALARQALFGLSNAHVTTAWAIRTTWKDAARVLFAGARPDATRARAFVIVLRGRFVCSLCSHPPGAREPRGRVSVGVWVPGKGVTDSGLTPHMPRGLRTLGRIVKVPVAGPPVGPDQLALTPESGIGVARIGASLDDVTHALHPAIEVSASGATYAFGPVEVSAVADSERRVGSLDVLSTAATIDGHPLSDGFTRLRDELPDWTPADCSGGVGSHVLVHRGGRDLWTRVAFAGDRVIDVAIGRPSADSCS